MQEHIQWLKDTLEISKEQAPILCNCISLCISDAESRLEKEKKQIIKSFSLGIISHHDAFKNQNKWNNGEEYYNKTFKSE